MSIFSRLFWIDASERAIATAAQVILSLGLIYLPSVALTNKQSLEVAVYLVIQTLPLIILAGLGGAMFSVLKSVVAAKTSGTDSASFTVDTKPLG